MSRAGGGKSGSEVGDGERVAAAIIEGDAGSRLSLALGTPLSAVLRLATRALAAPCALAAGAARQAAAGRLGWLTPAPAAWPWRRACQPPVAPAALPLVALQWLHDFVTPRRLGFGALALLTFATITAGCYAAYGWPFLFETYLYHFVRADNRHNFSPYFYDLYLRYDDARTRAGVGLLAMLPQLGTTALVGAAFYRDPPAALLLQTAVFVVWNKVITVQYFNWYLALVPLVLPQSRLAEGVARGEWRSVATAACLGGAWLLTEVRPAPRGRAPCAAAAAVGNGGLPLQHTRPPHPAPSPLLRRQAGLLPHAGGCRAGRGG